MGTSPSRVLDKTLSAGLTAEKIEMYYDTLAKYRASRADAGKGDNQSSTQAAEDDEERDGEDADTPGTDAGRTDFAAAISGINDDASLTPGQAVAAKFHLESALQALNEQKKDDFDRAIASLAKLSIKTKRLAKALLEWMKEHPWLTAAIIILIVLSACTPAILGAAGFGTGGIVAGSMAAGIQAGIGNVVAGSAFAVLTSAGMGGGGAVVVFGLVGSIPAAVITSIAILEWWNKKREAKDDKDDSMPKRD